MRQLRDPLIGLAPCQLERLLVVFRRHQLQRLGEIDGGACGRELPASRGLRSEVFRLPLLGNVEQEVDRAGELTSRVEQRGREGNEMHAATIGPLGHCLDIAHRPGLLSPEIAPRWFLISCAVYDTAAGALCYLPILRR